jgi:hypothetical protein
MTPMARIRRQNSPDPWGGGPALLALLALAASCGYQIVDERAALDPEMREIQFRSIENQTAESGFEVLLADALREEFARRGALKPVLSDGPARAALVLEGTVTTVSVRPSAFSSVALTIEDAVEVVVNLEITRSRTGAVVWKDPQLQASERFLASPDPQVYESNKEQALRRISSRLAQQVHDALFQAFVFQTAPAN